jgi:hypothetical protein
MQNSAASRFKFIGHALRGDGPFRPAVTSSLYGTAVLSGDTYLVRYPRESEEKFARRNELAFYASPLAQSTTRFVGYLSEQPPLRDVPNELYQAIVDDADGHGNSLDVFWQGFMVEAKARGTMLLLVDMPSNLPSTLESQMQQRAVPYLTALLPESVTEYEIAADGRFDYVIFAGTYRRGDGTTVDCFWRFDRSSWIVTDSRTKETLASGQHALGECPVIYFSESGAFPCFGQFAPIADLSRRLFNVDSELDEILRAQTFSLLTMQVPEGSTSEQKLEAAKVIGQTVGTNNLLVHSGQTPAFIAPPDGPARIYMDRIDKLQQRIDDIGLAVASPSQRESGISMQMRFHSINAAVAKFAERMEDTERRMWELCRRWLGMQAAPTTSWPRNFQIAEIDKEMDILASMQSTAMPVEVIAEQQKRVVSLQFAGSEDMDTMTAAIDERLQER